MKSKQLKAGKIITEAGEVKEVSPKNGKDYKLEELQKIVDGLIEVVRLTPLMIMVVNEEGKLNGSNVNPVATYLYRTCTLIDDVIHGDVLLCESKMVK